VAPLKGQKSPLLAAFCNSAVVSELPKRETRAISAKVSGEHREYSRFRETATGDLVRSLLAPESRGLGSDATRARLSKEAYKET
jgi:hypothetical protein